MTRSYFKEKTRYPIWVISVFSLLTLIPFFIAIKSEDTIPIEVYLSLGIILLVDVLFISISLELRVDVDGVVVRFIPFVNRPKTIRWDDLVEAKVRKSKPIKDYGGWGYRMRFKKRAYTLYGNWGLELTFKDGKTLFLGVRDHIELNQVMKSTIYPRYPELFKPRKD